MDTPPTDPSLLIDSSHGQRAPLVLLPTDPLPPLLLPSDVTAKFVLLGRHFVRERGVDRVLAWLAETGRPHAAFTVTEWPHKLASGRPDGEWRCVERRFERIQKYFEYKEAYAHKLVAKYGGNGPRVVSHGRTRTGGSDDESCSERSALFCDSDIGLSDVFCERLESIDYAYLYASRVDAGKFHCTIPFAEPWIITPEDARRPEFKERYREKLAFLYGVLSEVAQLPLHTNIRNKKGKVTPVHKSHSGFDGALAEKFLALEYLVSRRIERGGEITDPPTFRWREGKGLDLEAFLNVCGFYKARDRVLVRRRLSAPMVQRTPGTGTPPPTPPPSEIPDAEHPLLRALAADGLLHERISPGRYRARFRATCPYAAEHSSNENSRHDTSTAAIVHNDGSVTLKCLHDGCRDSRARYGLTRALSDNARAILAEIAPPGAKRVMAQLREIRVADIVTMSQKEVADYVAQLILDWKPGDIMVVVVPCGGGKSEGIRRAARRIKKALRKRRLLVGSPSHALAKQTEEHESMRGVAEHREGRLHAVADDGQPLCVEFEGASHWQRIGINLTTTYCHGCELERMCPASGADGGSTLVSTVSQLVGPIFDQIREHSDGPLTLIYDEQPDLVSTLELSRDDVHRFAGALVADEDLDAEIDANRRERREQMKRGEVPVPEIADTREFTVPVRIALKFVIPLLNALFGRLANEEPRKALERIFDVALTHEERRELNAARDRLSLVWSGSENRFVPSAETWRRFDEAAKRNTRRAWFAILLEFVELPFLGLRILLRGKRDGITSADVVTRERVARLYRTIEAIRALVLGGKAWRKEDGTIVVQGPSLEASYIDRYGAIILDATPDIGMLKAIYGDRAKIIALDVPDAHAHSRTILYRGDATRTHLNPIENETECFTHFGDMLRDGFTEVGDVPKVLVVSFKKIIERIKSGDCPDDLKRLIEWARKDRVVEFQHYGALRGLDAWMEFDGYLTIGDARPELESASLMSLTEGIGDPRQYAIERASAEQGQAHGRARDPSRGKPAAHCHVGGVAPWGWTEGNTKVLWMARGRPEKAPSAAARDVRSEMRAFVVELGGYPKAAAAIEAAGALDIAMDRTKLWRWVEGRSEPSDKDLGRLHNELRLCVVEKKKSVRDAASAAARDAAAARDRAFAATVVATRFFSRPAWMLERCVPPPFAASVPVGLWRVGRLAGGPALDIGGHVPALALDGAGFDHWAAFVCARLRHGRSVASNSQKGPSGGWFQRNSPVGRRDAVASNSQKGGRCFQRNPRVRSSGTRCPPKFRSLRARFEACGGGDAARTMVAAWMERRVRAASLALARIRLAGEGSARRIP